MDSLLARKETIFLCTKPSDGSSLQAVDEEIGHFKELCSKLVREEKFLRKVFALWMINGEGERTEGYSLAEMRASAKQEGTNTSSSLKTLNGSVRTYKSAGQPGI